MSAQERNKKEEITRREREKEGKTEREYKRVRRERKKTKGAYKFK
jgi:hypothetical protein